MTFEKTLSAGYLINHLARLFAHALHERIRPLGLTTGQFPTLLELWARDGLTQKELVQRLDIEAATMANTLARMERDGLIIRRSNPEDGRSQCVFLTAKARKLEEPATKAATAVNALALKDFSKEERDRLLSALPRLIEALSEDRS